VGPEAEGGRDAAVDEDWEGFLGRHAGADWYPDARKALDSWHDRVLATDDPQEIASMTVALFPLYPAHPDRPDVMAGLAAIAAGIPGADLELIPDCGHFPAIEAPQIYREAVLRFLNSLEDRSRR
jgi:pimeloyl-ACP methyl ester carboxylesterase